MDLTLVLGGTRSGKSAYAESLIASQSPPWVYVATGQGYDEEMRERIARHVARRGPCWTTVEAPIDLAAAVAQNPGRPLLVDCLTLWMSNLLLADHDPQAATQTFRAALRTRSAASVLVGSEVGLGIVPDNALARRFRDATGLLHQDLAKDATRVVLMVAGLPMIIK